MKTGRRIATVATLVGTLGLSALSAPTAHAADTGITVSNIVVNNGKPIVVGTSKVVEPPMRFNIALPSGYSTADPDRYDLDRDRESVGIASFGVGRHFCLGASLARMEARIVLEELVRRVSDYEIDPAGTRRVHSMNVRGFETLPTSVTVR